MTCLKFVVLSLAITNYASFSWAILFHFEKGVREDVSPKMKAIEYLGLTGMLNILYLLFVKEYILNWMWGISITLYITSQILFWWAIQTTRNKSFHLAFAEQVPKIFLINGPYRFIRNPFYSSYLITWIAGVFSTEKAYVVIYFVGMYILYSRAAQEEEQLFRSSSYGNDYALYEAKVGRFLPRLHSASNSKNSE